VLVLVNGGVISSVPGYAVAEAVIPVLGYQFYYQEIHDLHIRPSIDHGEQSLADG
jgi:hypothetical protein